MSLKRNLKLKRKLALPLVAITAIALAGGAYAATQSSSSGSRQAFLNDVAKRLNVAPAQLTSALQGAYFDRLAAEVAAGRLTQAQASAIEQQIKSSGAAPMLGRGGPGAVNGWQAGGNFRGALRSGRSTGPGQGGHFFYVPGFGFGFGFGLRLFGGGGQLSAAAGYLGLSATTLRSDLRSGKSLAQIATARGKTAAGLQSAMTAAIKASLDKAVTAKSLTSTQELKLLARLGSLLSAEIQRTPVRLGPMRRLIP